MITLQNNVNYINNSPIQIDPNTTNNLILFKFKYNSDDLFETKGKLILSFTFSFKNATIEIYDLENNLLNKVVNYQNIIYIWNTELNDFYIKIIDENENTYERTIYLKNALNLKTSNLNFLPFKYNNNDIIESVIKYRITKYDKIDIKYMVDFKECCKELNAECNDTLSTIYFYDLSKTDVQKSYLKVNWFTWKDFSINEIIRNKLGFFIEGTKHFKFNSQYKCAFSYYNKKEKRCQLMLSPIQHYQLVDNMLNLINHINSQYQYNSDIYRFLFNNPFKKSNDLIIEINSKN